MGHDNTTSEKNYDHSNIRGSIMPNLDIYEEEEEILFSASTIVNLNTRMRR